MILRCLGRPPLASADADRLPEVPRAVVERVQELLGVLRLLFADRAHVALGSLAVRDPRGRETGRVRVDYTNHIFEVAIPFFLAGQQKFCDTKAQP